MCLMFFSSLKTGRTMETLTMLREVPRPQLLLLLAQSELVERIEARVVADPVVLVELLGGSPADEQVDIEDAALAPEHLERKREVVQVILVVRLEEHHQQQPDSVVE